MSKVSSVYNQVVSDDVDDPFSYGNGGGGCDKGKVVIVIAVVLANRLLLEH